MLHADKQRSLLQMDTLVFDRNVQPSSFKLPKVPKIGSLHCPCKISKKNLGEVDILHGDKHQSFPQVDFNTLCIKVFCKVISLLVVMIKLSQSTQSSKFGISLQYLKKKKNRDGVHCWMQINIKVSTSWHYLKYQK